MSSMVKNLNKSYGKRSLKWTKMYLKRTKAIIREYMKVNNILEVEIKGNKVLCLEPVKNCDRALFMDLWLNDELSTKKLTENMRLTHWWVQYFLDDFLNMVEQNPHLNIAVGRGKG